MDIREYKEKYNRVKEIYDTAATPTNAIQQMIQDFGRSDTEKIFAIAAQVLFPDGLIIEEARRNLKRIFRKLLGVASGCSTDPSGTYP